MKGRDGVWRTFLLIDSYVGIGNVRKAFWLS